jgi:protein O-GlcNAc transferase
LRAGNSDTYSGPVTHAFSSGLAASSRAREQANADCIREHAQRLASEPNDARARLSLVRCCEAAGKHLSALEILEEGRLLDPTVRSIWWESVYKLNEAGRSEDARNLAVTASALFPNDLEFRLAARLILPVLYESEREIKVWRERFRAGLRECRSERALVDKDAARAALPGLGRWTNFYLSYQSQNDLALQKEYGSFVHHLMSAAMVQPPASGQLNTLRIRVGFTSPHLSSHSVGRMYLGWAKNIDRRRFEVLAYHMGEDDDSTTEHYRKHTDSFFRSTDLTELIDRISADQLDVLVHLDIGTTPVMTQLAALRLAPVQCTTWGHPVTSGLPTIDYYLSSELMEPKNGDEHYSESLVRLPGIGADYEAPVIPRPFMTARRSDLGIREDAVVFACCQSPFKYLPQYDQMLTAIARRVPESQFVFVVGNDVLAEKFSARLARSFREEGLDWANHCIILPWLSYFDYLQVYTLSDIFLDSIGFSSSSTTLEAIACGLPVVTCPGEFLRGRMAYGILTAMGLTETIGLTASEYVDVAVRLAVEPDFRRGVKDRMGEASRRDAIFGNKDSVIALGEFLIRIAPGNR